MKVEMDGKTYNFLPGDSFDFGDTGNAILFFPKSGVEAARTLLTTVMDAERRPAQLDFVKIAAIEAPLP